MKLEFHIVLMLCVISFFCICIAGIGIVNHAELKEIREELQMLEGEVIHD